MITTKRELQRAKKDLKKHNKYLTLYTGDNPDNPIIPTIKARIRIIEAQIEHSSIN